MPTHAASVPAAVVTPGSGSFGGNNSITYGWSFSTNTAITLTTLGFYDSPFPFDPGLNENHQVAVWDGTSGTLLTSGTVPAGTSAPLIGGFRYVDVTDILLTPGTTYTIAAFLPGPKQDALLVDGTNGTSTTFAAELTVLGGRADLSGSFVRPTTSSFGGVSFGAAFGPNFEFVGAPTVVPLPAAIWAGGVLVGMLATSRRRHRLV